MQDFWVDKFAESNIRYEPATLTLFDTPIRTGCGSAQAAIHMPPLRDRSAIGTELYHAYVVYDQSGRVRMASEPVPLTIVE